MAGMPKHATTASQPLPLRLVFARNFRLIRTHAGLSQERMAAESGLDRTFIGTLERGLRNISIDNIELIAQAVGIPAHALMDPDLPQQRGLDVTLTRAPRTARPYPVARKSKAHG